MRPVSRLWLALFCLCLNGPVAQSAVAGEQDREVVGDVRKTARMNCTIEQSSHSQHVALELTYRTRRQTAAERVEQAYNERHGWKSVPTDSTVSWRIVESTFAAHDFFGAGTQALCAQGCPLHEAFGIDVVSRVFVAVPIAKDGIRTGVEFSNLDAIYGKAPRAVLSFVGFGDYHGFVVELPGAPRQMKAACDW